MESARGGAERAAAGRYRPPEKIVGDARVARAATRVDLGGTYIQPPTVAGELPGRARAGAAAGDGLARSAAWAQPPARALARLTWRAAWRLSPPPWGSRAGAWGRRSGGWPRTPPQASPSCGRSRRATSCGDGAQEQQASAWDDGGRGSPGGEAQVGLPPPSLLHALLQVLGLGGALGAVDGCTGGEGRRASCAVEATASLRVPWGDRRCRAPLAAPRRRWLRLRPSPVAAERTVHHSLRALRLDGRGALHGCRWSENGTGQVQAGGWARLH